MCSAAGRVTFPTIRVCPFATGVVSQWCLTDGARPILAVSGPFRDEGPCIEGSHAPTTVDESVLR